MNEFTIEELQIILLDMNAYIHRTTILAESPSHKALRDKIESMIDNYCEHHDRVSSSDDNGHLVVQCGRCDLVMWHEKD